MKLLAKLIWSFRRLVTRLPPAGASLPLARAPEVEQVVEDVIAPVSMDEAEVATSIGLAQTIEQVFIVPRKSTGNEGIPARNIFAFLTDEIYCQPQLAHTIDSAMKTAITRHRENQEPLLHKPVISIDTVTLPDPCGIAQALQLYINHAQQS